MASVHKLPLPACVQPLICGETKKLRLSESNRKLNAAVAHAHDLLVVESTVSGGLETYAAGLMVNRPATRRKYRWLLWPAIAIGVIILADYAMWQSDTSWYEVQYDFNVATGMLRTKELIVGRVVSTSFEETSWARLVARYAPVTSEESDWQRSSTYYYGLLGKSHGHGTGGRAQQAIGFLVLLFDKVAFSEAAKQALVKHFVTRLRDSTPGVAAFELSEVVERIGDAMVQHRGPVELEEVLPFLSSPSADSELKAQ